MADENRKCSLVNSTIERTVHSVRMYVNLHSNRGEIDGPTQLRERYLLYANTEQKRARLAVEPLLLLLLVHTKHTSSDGPAF